jgi:putative phosphoesterase
VRAVVLADTHLKATSSKRLPTKVTDALRDADVILHAGDLTDASVLRELESFAPVLAVLGNNDVGLELPEVRSFDLDGVRVAMVHDSGQRDRRAARLHALFPDAQLVVFGHSHIPWNETGLDGQVLFNPGSPTQRRRQPFVTFGVVECSGGALTRHDIVRAD